VRTALDYAFRHNNVENIVNDLNTFARHRNPEVQKFAENTLKVLGLRSPTSLKIALRAIRQGKKMTLREALNMELKIASAFCVCTIILRNVGNPTDLWIYEERSVSRFCYRRECCH
jgi:3-hydroxyisobutyryl-CoA hydrolase